MEPLQDCFKTEGFGSAELAPQVDKCSDELHHDTWH